MRLQPGTPSLVRESNMLHRDAVPVASVLDSFAVTGDGVRKSVLCPPRWSCGQGSGLDSAYRREPHDGLP